MEKFRTLAVAGMAAWALAACGASNGVDHSLPMTPDKLDANLVHQFGGGSNPVVDANCDPQKTDDNGVGTYDCALDHESGMGELYVTVDKNGNFTTSDTNPDE